MKLERIGINIPFSVETMNGEIDPAPINDMQTPLPPLLLQSIVTKLGFWSPKLRNVLEQFK